MSDKKIYGQLEVNTESISDPVSELEVRNGGDIIIRSEGHPDRGGSSVAGDILTLQADGSVDYSTPAQLIIDSVTTSSGSADAGKYVQLDANGQVDESFLPVFKDKVQTKYLPANVTTDQTIASISFSGLTVGRQYQIIGNGLFQISDTDGLVALAIYNGPIANGNQYIFRMNINPVGASPNLTIAQSQYAIATDVFVAVDTVINVTAEAMSVGDIIWGNGTNNYTWLQLREIHPRNEVDFVTSF